MNHSEQRTRWLDPVPWGVFLLVVSIFTTICGGIVYQHSKIEGALATEKDQRIAADAAIIASQDDIKAQLSAIQADIKNLEYLIKTSR